MSRQGTTRRVDTSAITRSFARDPPRDRQHRYRRRPISDLGGHSLMTTRRDGTLRTQMDCAAACCARSPLRRPRCGKPVRLRPFHQTTPPDSEVTGSCADRSLALPEYACRCAQADACEPITGGSGAHDMSAGRSPDFASPNASDLVIAALIGGFPGT